MRVLPRLALSICLLAGTLSAAIHEKVIYSFNADNGYAPISGLLLDASGNIFGTTQDGGVYGNGTVFEVVFAGGVASETVLYSFQGGSSDGEIPQGTLVMDKAGNLFGTTYEGGNSDHGIVFELSPSQGGWTENIIHAFGSASGDGCYPVGGLVMDSTGNLYGTTVGCGTGNDGTVFELTPSGGSWSESVLWNFDGVDGQSPEGCVSFDKFGKNLFGTTASGGFYGQGNVFKLSRESGVWKETSIFSFTGGANGCIPSGGVVVDDDENLYGTTQICGADQVGTLFQLGPTKGQWTMAILHTFTGGLDGAVPVATLRIDEHRNLYGTTLYGGLYGLGTVFEMTAANNWAETAYSFKGGANDGANPYAGVVVRKGVVFGTTELGGTNNVGTIFGVASK